MPSVADHYERVLSPVYAWMSGGAEAALAAGRAEIEALNLGLPAGALVVDLGAGFGMHAIPMARSGARVVAIDSSAHLLAELKRLAGDVALTLSRTTCCRSARTSPRRPRRCCAWVTR